MTAAPSIRTARLILRPMTMADWPDYRDLWMSERSSFMGGPYDEFNAWGIFCNDVAQWALFGHGSLAIDHKDTGETLGQVGINHGPLFPQKELGWQLYSNAEGQGYAMEAAVALRDWAFDEGGLSTLVSYIDPNNTRSIALAKRLGAVLDDTAPKQDPEDLVFRHLRP